MSFTNCATFKANWIRIKNINKKEFKEWLFTKNYKEGNIESIIEDYFNEVLIYVVLESALKTIEKIEDSEAYKSGVELSCIFENAKHDFLNSKK